MDGLLAWAADVVGGDSDPESPSPAALGFRFTPEQLQEVGKLDKRAAELQHSLQQLRRKLPPESVAQRLPHLHAESLASQSALALELHAHSASRIQAQLRESSLQADIAAYTKALKATEQQAGERASEAQELEKSFQELGLLEEKLQEEYEGEKSLGADDCSKPSLEAEAGGDEEVTELQSLKSELAKWQTKAAEARKELSLLENEALAWPSSAQREKDLELRLRTLAEQLAAKQAQAEKLIIERDALDLRVEHAIEARKNPGLAHASTSKRNKIGVKHPVSDPEPRRTRVVSNRGGLGIYTSSNNSPWRRNLAYRALVVAYIFALHVFVIVILSYSSS